MNGNKDSLWGNVLEASYKEIDNALSGKFEDKVFGIIATAFLPIVAPVMYGVVKIDELRGGDIYQRFKETGKFELVSHRN